VEGPLVPSFVWLQPNHYKPLQIQLIVQQQMDANSDATVLMSDNIILKTLLPNMGTNMTSWMVMANKLHDISWKPSTSLPIPLPRKM
jgi:hypothetical protein